jgi:cellulose synthase/poly-beta-1,6-N-acetylglucosamine synthase-like glycosyltransferase
MSCASTVSMALAACLGLPVVLYPSWLRWRTRRLACAPAASDAPGPRSVSIIVVGRDAAPLLAAKVDNALRHGPVGLPMELWVVSDGPDPEMRRVTEASGDPRLRYLETAEWGGKNRALTLVLEKAGGDVLVFSDVDALWDPGALPALLEPFRDPRVGGVCGQRRLASAGGTLVEAQAAYVAWDSRIKRLESRLGRLTSNDGKLHAVRRGLVSHVPDGCTDDLYMALAVVRAGHRFVFAPGAVARVAAPSRSLSHEWERRRRVVCRSLRGLWLHRVLFDPRIYGSYSIQLFVNKVLRRFLALPTIAGAAGLFMAWPHAWPLVPLAAGLVLALPHVRRRAAHAGVGVLASAWGCVDFFRGVPHHRWIPRKARVGFTEN